MKIATLLSVLLLTVLLAVSATAQINWLKDANGQSYLTWDNGSKSKTILNGNSATFATGYFGSTTNAAIKLKVTLNSKETEQVVSTIISKNVNVAQSLGYEVLTIKPEHYQSKSGQYIVVIRLEEVSGNHYEAVDSSLLLTISPKIVIKPGIHFNPNQNHAPVMNDVQDTEVFENQKVSFTVSGTDADHDQRYYQGQICTSFYNVCWAWGSLPAGASLEAASGKFSWTPGYDFLQHPTIGKNTKFRFRAHDGKDYSEWAYTDILVKDVNRIPYFELVGNKVIQEGQILTIPLTGHDLDNDKLFYSYTGDILPGAVITKVGDQNGKLTWKPDYNAAAHSSYTIKIIVNDLFGGQRSEDITITVLDVLENTNNGDIAAKDVDETTDENQEKTITLFCKGGQGQLTYIAGSPAQGTLYNANGSAITYRPHYNYNGEDSFTYYCVDISGKKSNEATVTITINPVNDAPVAHDDAATTLKDTLVQINVLDNDVEPDGHALTIVDISNPQSNSAFIMIIEGAIEYTPKYGFVGVDSFEYTIRDISGLEATATVTVTVTEEVVNDDPQCSDRMDNDGDTIIDYPLDPGCQNGDDNETDETPEYPQCSDNLDNDNDGNIDMQDLGCETPQDDDESDEGEDLPVEHINIKLQSVSLAQEIVSPGDILFVQVRMFNNGNVDLEELKAQAFIYDLGAMGSTGEFALHIEQGASKNVYVPIPQDAQPGLYLAKVKVGNSHYHTSAYRLVWVGW